MTSTQIQVRPFEVGDKVFAPTAQDGTDIEVSYPASILELNPTSGIHVRSLVANSDGEFEEDWVNAADLVLASEPAEENTVRVEEVKHATTTVTFRDRAATGLKYGIPVIPLRGKAPFLPAWQNAATTTPGQINQWNAEFPDANCGMVAKAELGGFWCFEVDSPDVAKRYKEKTGNNLPSDTLLIQSRPGRGHRWFRHTAASLAMGNLAQSDVQGTDFSVRAHNEQAVAPRSIHPESGSEYKLVSDVEPKEAPDELVAWLVSQKISSADKTKLSASAISEALIQSGSRNSALTSLGGKLHHSGLSDGLVLEALLEANENRCIPPLSATEVETIAKSVCRYDTTEDIRPNLILGGTNANQPAVAVDPKDWRSQFKTVSQLEDGDVKMIVKGFLPEGTNFFGALSGHGKTLLGLSLAKALTTGRPMFEHFEVPEQIPVLYLIPESSGRAFKARLKKFGIPDDEAKFLCRTLTDGPTLLLDDPIIREAVKIMRPVVLLDTAIRFSTAQDENASIQNQKLCNDIIALRNAGARAVIGIHHSTKSSADAKMTLENTLRGTGDIGAMCDAVYGIRRDEQLYDNGDGPLEIEVVCVKPRDFEPPLPFRLIAKYRGEDGNFVSAIDSVGDFILQEKEAESYNLMSRIATIVEADPSISIRDLSAELKLNMMKVRRLLAKVGWSKPRGQSRWSLGPAPQAETDTFCEKNSLPSDEFLDSLLAGGSMLVSEVDAAFAKHKYTRSAIDSAKSALGVETFRKHGDLREWMRRPEITGVTSPDQEDL